MDTSDSKKLRILEVENQFKEIDAYLDDERLLKWSSAEIHKEREAIKALLDEINFYTEQKCELENDIKQDECKIKQTQGLDKILDEDIKKQTELQISYHQQEKIKIELVNKYGVMMKENSQHLRDSHKYYNKEYYVKELAMMEEEIEELSKKKKQAQNVIDELQRELDEMRPSVPYDIFNSIMGREENDEKLMENM